MKNGSLGNGSLENGSLENGSLENGSLENGSLENGSLENGSLEYGSLENGSLENDVGPVEPREHFLTDSQIIPSSSNYLLSYPDFETFRQPCDIEDTTTYQNTMQIPSGEGEEMVNSIIKPSIRNKNKTCSYCHKIFPTPSKLERHVRVHLGIKPFLCDHCDKRFSQEIHLKTHVKISHKDICDAMRQKTLYHQTIHQLEIKPKLKNRRQNECCKKVETIGKVFENYTTAVTVWKAKTFMDPLGQRIFRKKTSLQCTRSTAANDIDLLVQGYPTLSTNIMTRIWNVIPGLQHATTLGAAKSLATEC